jgi:protein required for attachment to host cells
MGAEGEREREREGRKQRGKARDEMRDKKRRVEKSESLKSVKKSMGADFDCLVIVSYTP